MKTKGITSGPPRAPPPTPIVTQATTTVDLKPKHITPDQVPVAVPTTPRRNKSGVWRTEAMPLRGGAPLNYGQANHDGGASIKAANDGANSDEEDLNDRDDRRLARGLSESPHFSTGASMLLNKSDTADDRAGRQDDGHCHDEDDNEDDDWCFVSGGQSPTSTTTPKTSPPLGAKLAKFFRS